MSSNQHRNHNPAEPMASDLLNAHRYCPLAVRGLHCAPLTQARERGEEPWAAPLIVEMQKVCKMAKITVEQLMWRETALGRLSQRAVTLLLTLLPRIPELRTIYTETQSVTVTNGVFNVAIGCNSRISELLLSLGC